MEIFAEQHISIYEGHSINKGNFFEKKSKMIFFRIFFHKFKLCIVWNWFIAIIILISQKYLFWGYFKWGQIKQSSTGLNRGLSSNYWWLRSVNHVKFTEECILCIEKHVLIKKIFKNGLCDYEPGLKWQAMVCKHIESLGTSRLYWQSFGIRKDS